ncbi:myosin-like coiled-coil protein-domain-containing protein [Xylariales sp. AK1849]|nr:myosin-like coiled-coil protein-domain-containing protein [Xylariales sp. AK1849]
MATANHSGNSATPAPLASNPITNGQLSEPRLAPTPAAVNANKKGKGKKTMDANEASRAVAATISRLEVDKSAEREQQDEIDREVKKHNRELEKSTTKMTELEKIEHLHNKCSQLFLDMKRHERESKKEKKRADNLQKERDAKSTDATRQTSLKQKLETLCRELQKENNKLKSDHRSLQDSHAKLKKDSDKRFEDVFKTLEGYQDEKDNPRKQVMNIKVEEVFKSRFKSLIDQYELRELHYHSHMRTKEAEVQYWMARYEEQKKAAEAESSRSRQLNGQVLTFHKTESELRNQLNVYVEKFKQVEDTLNNSNDLFLTFRKEMEDMSKKTKKLEKDNDNLKRKNDALNANILRMAEERSKNQKDLQAVQKKNETLTSIINQMQQQGRGIPQGMQGTVESGEEEESEYEDEYEEGDEGSEEGDFDDDTEEEVHEPVPAPRSAPYGPEPPPVSTPIPTTNGHL